MKRSSGPRKAVDLSPSIHHHLNKYALAASAAGVGMLASAAEAKIVYTPAHKVILHGSHLALDLNRDGITDFYINQRSVCYTSGCQAALYVNGAAVSGGNYVEGIRNAYALKASQRIGSTKPFLGGAMYYRQHSQNTSGVCTGSWTNVKNRYLGLRFLLKGETHFGWARLSVTCSLKTKTIGVLTGYAYETIANKPIIAGKTKGPDVITVQPASLGRLARGASAIASPAR
jgi:hypothetical protein